jgi:uncharacterized membrane protein (DUF4010 family)
MNILTNFEPGWRFVAALLIGALIGIEREFVQQRSGERDFAGIRTFSLMALLGAVSAYFSQQFGPVIFVAAFIGMALLVLISHIGNIYREDAEGITTEVVALIVPLLGAMVIWGEVELAAALGVITALILALKPLLHDIARRMSAEDMRATLEFALITAVVLPWLPNQSYGPFGLINPFQIWTLVVFVSGIGFLGYILINILGAEQGVGLTGVLGGLVSSTATTVSLAGRSKENPGLSPILARGIILASCVMFPRIMVEVAVIYPPLLRFVILPISVMFIASLTVVLYLWRRGRVGAKEGREKVEVSNPLRLITAISFALAFTVVLIVVRAASEYFGDVGVASALSGLTDVDAITLSVSELASFGQIQLHVAATSVFLAALVNTAAKAGMVWVLGAVELRRTIVIAYGLVLLAGIISGAFVLGRGL